MVNSKTGFNHFQQRVSRNVMLAIGGILTVTFLGDLSNTKQHLWHAET